MTDEQRIKTLEETISRLLQWIAAAEARISVVLGLDTAMLGAIAVFAPTPKMWSTSAVAFAAIAVTALALSLTFLAAASFPRTNGPKQSLIYFGGIAERDPDQFLSEIKTLTADKYIDDLSRQCHRNAQIALTKFSWIKRAKIALFFGIAPWAIALFVLYQLKQ